MREINTLAFSGSKRAVIYQCKSDDGLLVEYSHGRMNWFRVDTGEYIDLDSYMYWEPV